MLEAIVRAARWFYLVTIFALAIAMLFPSFGWIERLERGWGAGRAIQIAMGLALLGLVSEHILGALTRRRQGTLARAIQRMQPVLRHKDAIEILIRSLESDDPKVSALAHEQLRRITRQELPADAATWRGWLESEEKSAAG
jgi:hypothetical protein